LILAPPFVPILDALLLGSNFAKVIAFIIQTGAYSTISYIG